MRKRFETQFQLGQIPIEQVANYDQLVRSLMGLPASEAGGRAFHHKTLSDGQLLPLTTDQHHLIVDYRVMEQSSDAAETMPLAKRLIKRFGKLAIASMSFDQGFSRQSHREELEELVDLVVMPKKGNRGEADRQRESAAPFVKKRRAHSAVESNINSLEHHGLNRCPDQGLPGFKRYVGLGVLAFNLHRIGQVKIARDRQARACAGRPPAEEERRRYEQAMAA